MPSAWCRHSRSPWQRLRSQQLARTMCSAVCPPLFCMLTSASALMASSTIFRLPFCEAMWMMVLPLPGSCSRSWTETQSPSMISALKEPSASHVQLMHNVSQRHCCLSMAIRTWHQEDSSTHLHIGGVWMLFQQLLHLI